MDINQPQNLTKKTAIKRFLIILLFTIILTFVFTYIKYGRIPSSILIGFAIVIPMMIVSAIFGFKYRDSIANLKNKLWYFFLVLGILMAIFNLVLGFLEGSNFNYYLGIGIGLMSVIYSIYKIKNSQ